jgi:hypothetical protein
MLIQAAYFLNPLKMETCFSARFTLLNRIAASPGKPALTEKNVRKALVKKGILVFKN